jgi:hypothetical protein
MSLKLINNFKEKSFVMINHISVGVENPEKVANILAELLSGYVFPFPPCTGAFIIFDDGDKGVSIEVYPKNTEMIPGIGEPSESSVFNSQTLCFDYEVQFRTNDKKSQYSSTHIALNTKLNEEAIGKIAEKEGWRLIKCERGGGFFTLMEFWVENCLMLEVFTPEMTKKYQEAMKPQCFAEILGMPLPEQRGKHEPALA